MEKPKEESNLSIRIPTKYVQPPPMKPTQTGSLSDLKIAVKSSLVPKESPSRDNVIRFIPANNPINQYFQNRKYAQNQLATSLSKTNSIDHSKMKTNDDDSSDDSFIYGSRSKDLANTNNKSLNESNKTTSTNVIPQKRLFSAVTTTRNKQFEPQNKYPRWTVTNQSVSNQSVTNQSNQDNISKSNKNVNIWSWKASDVIEWLLSFDIGKAYLVNFARSEINGLKLTLLNDTTLQKLGVNNVAHRKYLLGQIAILIKRQNDHNQNIPFRCLYCNVYSPSRIVILQHMNQSHQLSLPMIINPNKNELNINTSNNSSGSNSVSNEKSFKSKRKDSKCQFCHKSYSSVYYLRKHLKKTHNFEQDQDSDIDMKNTNNNQESESESHSNSILASDDSNQNTAGTIEFKCKHCQEVVPSGLELLAHVAQHDLTQMK